MLPGEGLWLDEFQPLTGALLRRYGTNPEVRQDLRSEIHSRLWKLRREPGEAQNREAAARRMASHVHEYAVSHWGALPDGDLPDHDTARGSVRSALPAAIARLPHRQRVALVWHYFEDRDVVEIARLLRTTQPAVRVLLHQALASVRGSAQSTALREEGS